MESDPYQSYLRQSWKCNVGIVSIEKQRPSERADEGRVAYFPAIALDTEHGTHEHAQAHCAVGADVIHQEDGRSGGVPL
jgi:hypothetical protein